MNLTDVTPYWYGSPDDLDVVYTVASWERTLTLLREPLGALIDFPNHMEALRERFEYDPKTGKLYWRIMSHSDPGRLATGRGLNGAGIVKFDSYAVPSGRMVWLLHKGAWPKGRLRRKDGDVTNDRIENLVDPAENRQEIPPTGTGRRNKSRGVARCGPSHWQAYCRVNGKQYGLGKFKTEAEAIARRQEWEKGHDLV